jgi:hypothetical protein
MPRTEPPVARTKQKNIRLREPTEALLERLATRLGLDGTSVIHLAIHQLATRELGEEAEKILENSGLPS